jgi:hypothetical protein
MFEPGDYLSYDFHGVSQPLSKLSREELEYRLAEAMNLIEDLTTNINNMKYFVKEWQDNKYQYEE